MRTLNRGNYDLGVNIIHSIKNKDLSAKFQSVLTERQIQLLKLEDAVKTMNNIKDGPERYVYDCCILIGYHLIENNQTHLVNQLTKLFKNDSYRLKSYTAFSWFYFALQNGKLSNGYYKPEIWKSVRYGIEKTYPKLYNRLKEKADNIG